VINIIGQVAGKGIEMIGVGLLYGTKALSVVTRGVFFMGGKNVDMVETLRDMSAGGEFKNDVRLLPDHATVTMPHEDIASPGMDDDKIGRAFSLVRLAIEYGTRAYDERMLPIEEIVVVDKQATIMANAIKQYLRKSDNFRFKNEFINKAELFVQASSLFMKYHRTGNELFRNDAEGLIEEANQWKT